MDEAEILKKIRKIEIKTRGLSKQTFSGEYHSAFKGRGMTFSEVKNYQYGDDVRNIDWNVTARFNEPFVKVYEEERELSVFFILDISGSNNFGTTERSKKELLIEITAVLAFSAIHNNDKVGAILISDKIEKYIPPNKGKSHAMRILKELIHFQPNSSGTNLQEGIRFFNNIVKKRSISFVISDFNDNIDFLEGFKIAKNKHDMVAFKIFDSAEQELPNLGLLKMYDAESNKIKWVNTSAKKVRRNYKENYLLKAEDLKNNFRKAGVDFTSISTQDDYFKVLNTFFKSRG